MLPDLIQSLQTPDSEWRAGRQQLLQRMIYTVCAGARHVVELYLDMVDDSMAYSPTKTRLIEALMPVQCRTCVCPWLGVLNSLHGDVPLRQAGPPDTWSPEDPWSQHQMDMQLQLAGIVAAAVHEGLISVHEGVCDVIDACSPVVHKPDQGRPSESEYLSRPFGQWSGCIVEQYMAASMPGKAHLLLGMSKPGDSALPDCSPLTAAQQQLTALIEAWVQELQGQADAAVAKQKGVAPPPCRDCNQGRGIDAQCVFEVAKQMRAEQPPPAQALSDKQQHTQLLMDCLDALLRIINGNLNHTYIGIAEARKLSRGPFEGHVLSICRQPATLKDFMQMGMDLVASILPDINQCVDTASLIMDMVAVYLATLLCLGVETLQTCLLMVESIPMPACFTQRQLQFYVLWKLRLYLKAEADGEPLLFVRQCPALDTKWLETDQSTHFSKLIRQKQQGLIGRCSCCGIVGHVVDDDTCKASAGSTASATKQAPTAKQAAPPTGAEAEAASRAAAALIAEEEQAAAAAQQAKQQQASKKARQKQRKQAKRTAQQPQPCPSPTELHSGPDSGKPGGVDRTSLLADPQKSYGHDLATDDAKPRPPQDGAQETSDSAASLATSECIICWEAAPNVLLQPCGHICACSGCVALLEPSDCPVCRCKVDCTIIFQL